MRGCWRRGSSDGSGSRVSVFGFRISGFGFRVPGLVFRVSGSGFRVSSFVFRVPGLGVRFWVFGFRVSSFGFRGSSSGVEGPMLRVPCPLGIQGLELRIPYFRFRVSCVGVRDQRNPEDSIQDSIPQDSLLQVSCFVCRGSRSTRASPLAHWSRSHSPAGHTCDCSPLCGKRGRY